MTITLKLRGIIHRDVKPANVMLLTDGSVKIVDFGIARIGDTGISRTEVIGSLHYMSPEQFQSQPLDSRTDISPTGVNSVPAAHFNSFLSRRQLKRRLSIKSSTRLLLPLALMQRAALKSWIRLLTRRWRRIATTVT